MGYKDLMKSVLMMAVKEITNDDNYEDSELLQGQEMGLLLAIDKVEASSFLLEKWKEA